MSDYSRDGLTLEERLAIAYGAPATGYGDYDQNEINEFAEEQLLDGIDTQTGGSNQARAMVAAAQNSEDKLATLRNFYPGNSTLPVEALSPKYGEARFGSGNYVFMNEETGKLTLFDQDVRLFGMPIPDGMGDFLDAGPEIAETVGAIGGGIGAGVLAAPTGLGAVPAVMIGEGVGSAAAREAYIGMLDYFGQTEDTRSGVERLASFSTTAGLNAAAGPLASKIWKGVTFVAGSPARYANAAMDKGAEEALKAMQRAGVTDPTLGQVSGSPLYNQFESLLAMAPTSTMRMMEIAEQTIRQLDEAKQAMAKRFGGARTTEEAADLTLKSAQKAKLRYKAKRDAMYKEIYDEIDGEFSPATNVIEWYTKHIAKAKTPIGSPIMKESMTYANQLIKQAKDGNLSFADIKELRTSIKSLLGSPQIMGGMGSDGASKEALESLTGYMKKDMDDMLEAYAAKQIDLLGPNFSGPQVPSIVKKYKAANKFVQDSKADGSDIRFIYNVVAKGKDDAVSALQYALRGKNDSGARLRKMRNQFTPEEYEVISGYIFGQMGLPYGAAADAVPMAGVVQEGVDYIGQQGFNIKRFLKAYNEELSKEAKDVLFRGTQYEDLLPALDDLVFTLERINNTSSQMLNTSGTAKSLFSATVLLGAASDVGGLLTGQGFEFGLGGLAFPAIGAEAMTNPTFVRWMAKAVDLAANNPNSFPQHIRRLVQIAELNPDSRDWIMAIVQGLGQETIEPIDATSAKTKASAPKIPENNEFGFRKVVPSSVADKLLPTRDELLAQMDSIPELTAAEGEQAMFDPLPSTGIQAPSSFQPGLSPTVVPNEADRELASRMQANSGGIAALV